MARNTNPWFKLMTRDYLSSERIMEMSLAAEGLYNRCLILQAERGSIPSDLQKLARVLQKPYDEVAEFWHEVAPHFKSEVVDGEERLFNDKQRKLIKESEAKARNYSKAQADRRRTKSGTNPVQICTKSEPDLEQNRALRASVSDSVSVSASVSSNTEDLLSDTETVAAPEKPKKQKGDHLGYDNPQFCEFMDLWPRKNDRAAAYKAYRKQVTTEAMHERLMRRSREALGGIFAGRDVSVIKYPASWLNSSDWIDENVPLSAAGVRTPAYGIQSQPEPSPYVSLTGEWK